MQSACLKSVSNEGAVDLLELAASLREESAPYYPAACCGAGLNSQVLASNNEMVILPVNEPTFGTPRKSQIQTYLEQNEVCAESGATAHLHAE